MKCQICGTSIPKGWNEEKRHLFDLNGNNYQGEMLYCPKCWDFILKNPYRTSDPNYKPLYSGQGMSLRDKGYLWCKHYPRVVIETGRMGIHVVMFKAPPEMGHTAFQFDPLTGQNPGLHTNVPSVDGGCICTFAYAWDKNPELLNLD